MQVAILQENIDVLERYKPLAPNYFALFAAIVTNRNVDQILAEFGLLDVQPNRYNFTRAEKENMLKLHNEGVPYQRIAKEYGCSWQTVQQYVTQLRRETGTQRKRRTRRANRKDVIHELTQAILYHVEQGWKLTEAINEAKELIS